MIRSFSQKITQWQDKGGGMGVVSGLSMLRVVYKTWDERVCGKLRKQFRDNLFFSQRKSNCKRCLSHIVSMNSMAIWSSALKTRGYRTSASSSLPFKLKQFTNAKRSLNGDSNLTFCCRLHILNKSLLRQDMIIQRTSIAVMQD